MKTIEWRTMLGLVLAVGLFSAGCATTQSTEDGSDRQVQGSPPENAEPEPMPPGPNVKTGEPEIPGEETDEPKEPTAGADETASETDEAASEEGEPVTTSEIDRLQELGPSYIFQVVRLEPFRTDGDFRGYEIVGANSTAKNVMYPQIEVGDVVTHVNGVHLKRPDDYMQAWKKLDRVDAITVDLLRDGEEAQAVWSIQVTR
jgi:hypothetical protein